MTPRVATEPLAGGRADPAGRGGAGPLMLAVLVAAYVLSFVDRSIINLLVVPIKQEFALSDVRMSFLQGLSFALLLSLSAIPIGRLVDTVQRTRLLVLGVLVWSVATAACGIATSYWQLLGCRIFVGIGEAVLLPAAYSLIGDAFPARRQGIASGLFTLGAYVGSGAALVTGAVALRLLPAAADVPVIGLRHGWQLLFLALLFPGVFIAALLKLVAEPVRRSPQRSTTLNDALRWFPSRLIVLAPVWLTMTFAGLSVYALLAWAPTFFQRHFGVPATQIGYPLGMIVMGAGIAGTITAGLVGDRVARDHASQRLLLFAAGTLLAIPCFIAALSAAGPSRALALLAPAIFFLTMGIGCGPALVQQITPPHMRGLVHAVAGLMISGIGLGFGPTAVALLTDHVFQDESRVGVALSITLTVACLTASACALLAVRPYERLRERQGGDYFLV